MREKGLYKVLMDKRWELDDFYEFPHAYSQTYSFIYCLDSELDEKNAKRINYALENYPWRGGYSYVNIYTVLANRVPKEHKPEVARIQYASPGFMDILLNPDVAFRVAKSVGFLVAAGVTATEGYMHIRRTLNKIESDKNKQKIKNIEYSEKEVKVLISLIEELSKNIGFRNFYELNNRTKDPIVTLKILMAHYRRLTIIGNFVREGKLTLPVRDNEESDK